MRAGASPTRRRPRDGGLAAALARPRIEAAIGVAPRVQAADGVAPDAATVDDHDVGARRRRVGRRRRDEDEGHEGARHPVLRRLDNIVRPPASRGGEAQLPSPRRRRGRGVLWEVVGKRWKQARRRPGGGAQRIFFTLLYEHDPFQAVVIRHQIRISGHCSWDGLGPLQLPQYVLPSLSTPVKHSRASSGHGSSCHKGVLVFTFS